MTQAPTRRVALALARRLTPAASAALLMLAGSQLHAQQLIAPTATVASFSQSYLLSAFSQWVLSYPAAINPALDQTGANSALGDQGKYFFLAGSFDGNPLVRNVTVRPDQTLMLNLQVVTVWPDADETEADLRAIGSNVLGNVNSMSITVDGAPALLPAGYSSLVQLRNSSPLFPLSVTQDNLGGWPPGIYPAIADGYLIAMEGLSAGNHQVRWTFNSSPTGPFDGQWTNLQDITYNITSVPEASTWLMMGLGLAAVSASVMRRRRGSES
jgi:hypothetical protein